jgi:hypothetical protein
VNKINPDYEVGTKMMISGEIVDVAEEASQDTFYAKGRYIQGYSFDFPLHIQPGEVIEADLEFFGDPFHQNYQISNATKVT